MATHNANILPEYKFKTIIISDTHLGKKAASAAFLFDFLRHATSQRLILNGDILEGWGMKHKKRKPFPELHARCLDALNSIAESGTEMIYIRGNHDEDWAKGKRSINNRTIVFQDKNHVHSCPIEFRKSYQHTDAKGRNFLVLHGDVFDGFMKSTKKKVIAQYADRAYEGLVHINGILRQGAQSLGGWHISPAAYLKRKTKRILGIIGSFESAVTSRSITNRFDGVICGHIHHAEITQKPGMLYMNSGDWVESCTALAEDFDGNWRIIDWGVERDNLNLGSLPTIEDHNPYQSYRGVTMRQLTLARLLWPGTNFSELTDKLREYREKMKKHQNELSDIFARGVANDNPKKLNKLLHHTERITYQIEDIQNKMRPHP